MLLVDFLHLDCQICTKLIKLFGLVRLCQFIDYACDEVEKYKENYPRKKPLRGNLPQ